MKQKIIVTLIVSLLLFACSDSYKQRYSTFDAFDKVNQRNKSWFPDLIVRDAYDFKNDSYLDELCAFGSFRYLTTNYYDSVFNNSNAEQIELTTFKEKVLLHKDRIPTWFIKPEMIESAISKCIKVDRFYIARDSSHSTLYFVLSN